MNYSSLFKEKSNNAEKFTELNKDIETDVVIIGGGITGLMCAYLLNEAGIKSVVLEALNIGDGTTGFSSAHLTTDLDFGYHQLNKLFNQDTIKLVAESRIKGIELIEEIIKKNNISCGFEKVNGYYFTENKEDIKTLENEFNSAREAGLQVSLHSSTPLPFKSHASIQFNNQAQFDSQQFINGIAKTLRNSNCEIYENTRAINKFKEDGYQIIETAYGRKVKAKNIIMATHTPLFTNVIQTLTAPYISYVISAKLKGNKYPEGLFWDTDDPYHYIRTYKVDNESYLIVGGEDHKAGHQNTMQSFELLEKYVRERFDVEKIVHRWSGEYFEPSDGLPYIGNTHFADGIYIATGFSGDGLVYGPIAAKIITDLILEKENKWLYAYDAKRFTPIGALDTILKENVDNVSRFIKDRFVEGNIDDLNNLKSLEGKIVKINGEKIGVCKDENNQIHAVSPVCTHLKCIVQWNRAEQLWECPCHGSRFSKDGKVLTGPAVHPLKKVDIKLTSSAGKKRMNS